MVDTSNYEEWLAANQHDPIFQSRLNQAGHMIEAVFKRIAGEASVFTHEQMAAITISVTIEFGQMYQVAPELWPAMAQDFRGILFGEIEGDANVSTN